MRGLVAKLPHIVTTKVERGSAKHIFRQRNISKCVFALHCPGYHLATAYCFVLAVVDFQTVKVIIASEYLIIHHSPEVEVGSAICICRNIACVIRQQETEPGAEIFVSVFCTSCRYIRGFVNHSGSRFGNFIIVQIDLGTRENVALSQTEQEPWVYLDAAVTVFAGIFSTFIIFISGIADAIKILDCIFI